MHWAFLYISALPIFATSFDLVIQKLGVNYHYTNISRGLIETKDIVYFISIIVIFVYATIMVIQFRK
jgi:ABC-2 type transport system permease protein